MGSLARGLILDYFGVLTSNMVEVTETFEERENIPRGSFLRASASPTGRGLFASLELGEINQEEWNIASRCCLTCPPTV